MGGGGSDRTLAPSHPPTAKNPENQSEVSGQKCRDRPTALTEAVAQQLKPMVRAGLTLEAARTAAGVSPRSVRRSRAHGRLDLERELAAGEVKLAPGDIAVSAAVVAGGRLECPNASSRRA